MKRYSILIFLPWFVCSLGALFYAYEYFLRITPSVMTEDLSAYYHINAAALGSLSAFYYYIYTPMQLGVGVLMDRYGPRRLLVIATACCVIGSYLFAATPYFVVANIGRFLVGFGSAFGFVGVLKLATIWLPRRYFAMFSGLATALGMLGAASGDWFLSAMVSRIGWQETVYISAFFGVALAFLISLFVRDHSMERKKAASTCVTDMRSALTGLYKIAISRQMWIVGLIGGLLYIPTSAFAELWGVQYLEQAHSLSKEGAAFAISMIYIGWAVGGPVAGWISDTIKRRNAPLVIQPLIATVLIMVVLFVTNLPYIAICAALFVFGVLSAAEVIVFAIGRELNSLQTSATSIAFVNMVVMLSGVIFQPLIGVLLDSMWTGQISNGSHVYSISAYQIALSVLPIGLLLASLLARFALTETYCQQEKGSQLDEDEMQGDILIENRGELSSQA